MFFLYFYANFDPSIGPGVLIWTILNIHRMHTNIDINIVISGAVILIGF